MLPMLLLTPPPHNMYDYINTLKTKEKVQNKYPLKMGLFSQNTEHRTEHRKFSEGSEFFGPPKTKFRSVCGGGEEGVRRPCFSPAASPAAALYWARALCTRLICVRRAGAVCGGGGGAARAGDMTMATRRVRGRRDDSSRMARQQRHGRRSPILYGVAECRT
jgi:hypothetical protein